MASLGENQAPALEETVYLSQRRGCGGIFFTILLVGGALWGAALGGFVWIIEDTRHTIQALDTFRPKVGSKVYSADGEMLGEFAMEQRELVNLSQIPLRVQKAFIATEDDKFYTHRGVRPDAILNAVLYVIQTGRTRGGSTITQQVARGIADWHIRQGDQESSGQTRKPSLPAILQGLTTDENLDVGTERTIKRKLREAIIAFQLERQLTKDEILELYLNGVFLGVSARGVEAAARQYFCKDVWDVTLGEAALLAGLSRAPNRNEPFHFPENAHTRRDIVLKQMLDNQFITQEEYEAALQESVDESVITPEERAQLQAEGKDTWTPNTFEAPYFVEDIRQYLQNQTDQQDMFYNGLEIHTTVDMRLQRAAEEVLLKALDEFDAKKLAALKKEGKENEFVPVTGALVCLDNRSGYKGFVRAMVGGRDFETQKYNCATQAKRQPGSSIKPFVWATAIDNGYTPSSIEVDEPYVRVDPWGNRWSPKNFSGTFAGPVTLRTALEKSINIVSIKLTEHLTAPLVRSLLERVGIPPIDRSAGLTIALGTQEVTPLNHCVAYSTFANLGVRYEPVMVTEIKNRDGITLYDYHDAVRPPTEAMRPNVAYVMTHLMEGVCTYGTGAGTAAFKRPRAGKTGTANDSRDVWFCGFTPYYTCVVWLGYADHRPLGQGKNYTGGRLACPIWTEFMIRAEEGLPVKQFEEPEGIVWYSVDHTSGLEGGNLKEAFLADTAPPREMVVPETEPEVSEMDLGMLETL